MGQNPNRAAASRQVPEHHQLRVLVVEDNLLIAEALCDLLKNHGCAVFGPASDLNRSRALIDREQLDGALLDIKLGGILSFPLAALLEERGVPFVFVTGYDEGVLFPSEFKEVRRISKPYDPRAVSEIIEAWGRMAGL